jgi:transcriptional regulator with XRE-family HTH domain
MEIDVRIGSRLRELRRERGLTISQLAERTGLTNGFISQLERDLSSASLSSLARICDVLGVRIGDVTDPIPAGDHELIKLRGHVHVLLTPRTEHRFHVAESHIPPGGASGEEPHTLPADVELIYVRAGTLEFRVRDEVVQLSAGDSFTYSPRDPHAWRNPSDSEDAIVLWLAVPNPYVSGL